MQNNVPPFMVFTEEQVKEIAQKKPRNKAEFQNIHGVNRSGQGEIKADKYGEAFIKLIKDFLIQKSQEFQEGNEIQELEETEYAILKALYSDAKSVNELRVQFEIENPRIQNILRQLTRKGFIKLHRYSRNRTQYYSTEKGKEYTDNMLPPGTE